MPGNVFRIQVHPKACHMANATATVGIQIRCQDLRKERHLHGGFLPLGKKRSIKPVFQHLRCRSVKNRQVRIEQLKFPPRLGIVGLLKRRVITAVDRRVFKENARLGLDLPGRWQRVMVGQVGNLRPGIHLAEGFEYSIGDKQCLVTVAQAVALRAAAPSTTIVAPVKITARGGAQRLRQGNRIIGNNLHPRGRVHAQIPIANPLAFFVHTEHFGGPVKILPRQQILHGVQFVFNRQAMPPASSQEFPPGR